jgi:hypothetical protein
LAPAITVDSTDLTTIHAYEAIGFRFIGFWLFKHLRIDSAQFSTRSFYPFKIEMLNADEHLAPAITIMNQHKDDDRFSIDPLIPRGMAKKRLKRYITEAFRNFPSEFILGFKQ